MTAANVISLVAVHKSYRLGERVVKALRGANLEIDRAGFFAIMGVSGSGKSTLLHLLAGLDCADRGEIHVAGRALHTMSERELTAYRRHDVGMIFQQFNLIPTLTAFDNVVLPGMLDGMSNRALLRRGNELLEALGMSDRAEHRPDALSGGEQQRVAIARALFFSPRVLLADEPTGNLDSENGEQLWVLLRTLAQDQEMTVVTVTHEPSVAIHSQRVYILHDGVIEGSFDVDGADAAELAARYQNFGGSPR